MKKVSSSQISSIIYLIVLANTLGTTSNILFSVSKQDTWISVILSIFVGLIPIGIFLSIMNYHPELSILEKNKLLFGKFVGNIINTILTMMIFFMAIVALWEINNFASSQYLHLTPALIISISVMMMIAYLLSKDLVVIARVSFILFVIGFSLYFIGFLGLVWQFDANKITPILEHGIKSPIYASFLSVCYNTLPLFMLTIIPKNNIDVKNLNKLFIIWYVFASFIIFIITIIILGIFGYKLAILFEYTPFHLLKNISLFGFIDRVESTISIRWLFYLTIFITMSLYFVLEYFKNIFKIKKRNKINITIIIISIVIIVITKYIFINNTVKDHFMQYYYPYIISVTLFVIPLFIFIKSKFSKA